MQRRADLYPIPSSDSPDVLTYSPERWDNWAPKIWNYIPFNGGPRICIGQQFALAQIGESASPSSKMLGSIHTAAYGSCLEGYTIVRFLQRFERIDVRWRKVEEKIKCEVVISPAHGVKVGFWEK